MRPATEALWAALMLAGLQQLTSLATSPDSSVDRSSQNLPSVPRDLPPGVEFLDLSHNHIRQLHQGDFKNTTLLRRLNVSWNSLEGIDPGTFLNTPLLEDLDLSHNRLRNLSGQQYLLHTGNLLLLNLTWNSFVTMTLGDSFRSLAKLERLALEAENISVGDFKSIAEKKLQTLTLCLGDELGYEAGSLKDVHAQRLQIASTSSKIVDGGLYSDALSFFDEVELMNLTGGYRELTEQLSQREAVYNFFINMPVESFSITESPIIHMTCPKSQSPMLQLDFSYCALSDTIFSMVEEQQTLECQTLSNVRKLILVSNNLKSLQLLSQRMQHMKSLQHLDLSLNSLYYEGIDECVWPANITNMTLSSNRLTDSVFKCLPKGIETLDLQNNQVSVVSSSILKMESLTSLNLIANRLRDLPVCDGFPKLNELLLGSNSLHAPSVNRLETCPELRTLDVSYNPFTCTCALRSFIRLGIESERKNSHRGIELLRWPGEYYCTYPEDVRDTILKDIWIQEITCNVGVLAATILCPAVVVILVVMTLCHRLDIPWYMGMIWQWTRAKHRARTRQVRPEDLIGVEFHAFVSYSQHDTDWVHDSLLPNLEGPAGGLRICLHEKHFVPGKTVVENILGCVEKSRRSLFVLSAHFVKSDWCHYELYFASHQRLSRGSDSIVLVLLEPLPQYTIPSKYYQLKAMMGRHTYLEWPQDRAKHRLFWVNLRAALQADLPNAPVTEIE
ncbi:toll-like receptor 1 isoform X2 [Pleuronectes platessa]|uniref:toll-like receptor 1 isoform X2 n=1 Tax=Pleuronectes platessa TaxID=8262 RepID=UPI00232A7658|nr:toll-like receptor 1 isoform X2 [Pleuronectes platessa]